MPRISMKLVPSLKQSIWLLCSAALMFFCIWQWARSTHHFPHLLDQNTLEQTTNSVIYDLQYREYGASGSMTHFLETPEIHHIPKNDIHILTTPHLVVTEPNQAPWEMRADQGTSVSKAKTITFNHHVEINQHKPHEEMVLKTEHLTYYPQEKKAMSSDETIMTQGGTKVRSQGFVADLTDNHIHLKNARGQHVQNAG